MTALVRLSRLILVLVLGSLATPAAAAPDTIADILDDAWRWTLQNDLSAQIQNGAKDLNFPAHGEAATRDAAAFAAAITQRIDKLDARTLSHEDQILARTIRSRMDLVQAEWTYYWIKPVLTPYQMGFTINAGHQAIHDFRFESAEDLKRYDRLLAGYETWLRDAITRSIGKHQRGLDPSRAALPGIRTTIVGLKAAAPVMAAVPAGRISHLALDDATKAAFSNAIAARLKAIDADYDALIALIDGDISRGAPAGVGLHQYPGGDAYYAYLASLYTSASLSPRELHAIGLSMVADIEARMAKIRKDIGFTGSHKDFLQKIRTDPQFIAKTPDAVEAQYNGYIARIEPLIGQYFHKIPAAPYRVARLDPKLEKSVTYGFYKEPEPGQPYGTYYYNGSELEKRPMITAAGLMYHELLPGHHFHIATQLENKSLHPFRKSVSLDLSAYNEGWAEYAAGTLGREMGLYRGPYEEYGRLLMDMFFAVRITVDTGMNAMGWPLEKARQFMADRLITSDAEVASETLRYSTDIQGQSMAYGMGSRRMIEIRAAMQKTLGKAYDVRDFNDAVLSLGAVPLDVLADHIKWVADQKRH